MMRLALFNLLGYTFLAFWVATCSRPVGMEPAPEDSLALQHRLSHAVDSVDSTYHGCTYVDGMRVCPNVLPPGPP